MQNIISIVITSGFTWFCESDYLSGATVKIIRLGIGVSGDRQPCAGRQGVSGGRSDVRIGGSESGQRFDGQRLHQEPRGPRLSDIRFGRHAQLGQYLLFDRLYPLFVQAGPGGAVVVSPATWPVLPPVMVPVGAGSGRRRHRCRCRCRRQ